MNKRIARPSLEDRIDECHRIVDDLVKLHQQTDPIHGKKSEEHKQEKALQALNKMGLLAGILTEWAECQIFGSYYKVSKSPSDWIDAKDANGHDNEIMWYGDNVPEDFWTTDNDLICERLAIAKILKNTFSRYGRMGWRLSLEDCLHRLNEGEISDLLTPLNTGQHGNPFDLQALRWAAIKHVYKMIGETGLKKMAVETHIAEHCGISHEAIRKWEKEAIKARDKDKSTLTAVKLGGIYIHASKSANPSLTDKDILQEALQFNIGASLDLDKGKDISSLSFGIIQCIKLDEEFPLKTLSDRLKNAGLREKEAKKGTK